MKSNPNGIIFLGVGVLLIALAYTNRGKAVWAAVKGDANPATGTAKTSNPNPAGGGKINQ